VRARLWPKAKSVPQRGSDLEGAERWARSRGERRPKRYLASVARKGRPVVAQAWHVHPRHCVEAEEECWRRNQEHEAASCHLSQTFGGMFVINGQFGADDGAATLQGRRWIA